MSPLEFDPELADTPTLNVALVGPPKTGKTAGAASAPGKILYLSADLPGRMRFARRLYGDKLAVVSIKGLQTLIDATHAVNEGEYATVVLDPVGEAYRAVLEDLSGRAIRPTLNQYGDTAAHLERFCKAMCRADVNAVFVCHDHPVKDEASGETERLPWTGSNNPKLGRTLLGSVDIIGYTGRIEKDDGTVEYAAQLVPAKGRPGGDGFNCLGPLRKLDLTEWIECIEFHEQQSSTTTEEEAA